MPKRLRIEDENELAKSVIDEIIKETESDQPEKIRAAVALGRFGCLKGGKPAPPNYARTTKGTFYIGRPVEKGLIFKGLTNFA